MTDALYVALLVSAWIEIGSRIKTARATGVALLVSAWIEMDNITGLKISKPITQKIFKVDNNGKTINYKAGE